MSDALFRLSHDLVYGKVDPKSVYPDWQMNTKGDDSNPPETVRQAIDNVQPGALIESLRPKHTYCARLRQTLADYRQIAAKGGWSSVPAGPA